MNDQQAGDDDDDLPLDATEQLESVSMDEVAQTAVELTRWDISKRAQLRTALNDPAPVWAIAARLVQVVVNLLINAAHAVEHLDRGEITLRTGNDENVGWLEVVDNGPGISPEIQRRIFDPFFTTKSVGEGTGLGLAISDAIVRSAGGTLEVRSQQGEGATFRLSIPRFDESHEKKRGKSLSETLSRGRILLVDDEPLLGRALIRLLEPHEVIWCESGPECLSLLKTDKAFDLVLCDLMMSPMDGWSVLENIRATNAELLSHFAFTTGGAFTKRSQELLEETDIPVLHKPLKAADINELLAAINADKNS